MSLLAPTPLIPGAIAPAPRSSISTNVVLAPLSAETFAVRDSIVVFDSKRLGTSGEGTNPVSLGPASSLQDLTAAGRTVQVTALDTPSGLFSFTARPASPAAAPTAWTLVDPGGAEARVEGSGYVTLRASNTVLNYDLPIWETYEIPLQSRVTIVGGDGTEYRGATVTLVIDGATATAAALTARAPAWATLRGTIPNLDPITAGTSYSGLGGVVQSADEYVSENLTKMGFVADGTGILTTGALTFSFNEFEEQLALVENIAGHAAPFDWHGAVWHSSLPPAVVQRLMDHPDEVKALLTTILSTGFAYRPWLGFDVNEVQRTTSPIDADRDYWRGPLYNPPGTGTDGPAPAPSVTAVTGPITRTRSKALAPFIGTPIESNADHTSNGSIWYQAFAEAEAAAPGYWPHDPGYWWLHTVGWANANSKKVVYQDFNFEAGRLWGTTTDNPAGYTDASAPRVDELLKRRRILDAINYALVHGYRIDAVAFQSHIRTDRMLDRNDLRAFLRSLHAMGVGVEVTELDVEPSGLPLGYLVDHIDAGATPAERAEILAYAGAYTRNYLGVLLEHPQAVRFGWWSDWTPPGGLSRFSAIDRTGATEIGEGLLAALNAAPAPASRPAPAISRRYMLTNGLAADQWRAAIGGGRGMASGGNGDGTKPEAGSGGAVLPLVLPVTPTPGDAPPPVWWDTTANAGAGGIVGYDPAAMALAMQWRSESVDGPILTLRNGAVVVAVLALAVGRITLTAGAVTRDLGAARNFAQSRIALSWAALSLSAAYHDGLTLAPEPAALTLASAPTNIVILGDGTATNTAVRGCVLEVFKDPLDLAGRATWAAPQGADVPSAAEILAG